MGKDIHLLTEVKRNGIWEPINEVPNSYEIRNYLFFDILERIGHMGIPEELRNKKFRYNSEYNYWEMDFTDRDLFHHSYVSLDELIYYIENMNKVIVSEEFLEKFFELGGVLPEGMSVDEEDGKILVESEDEYERNTKEIIKNGIEELKKIADKYDVCYNDIRLVYAFDW